MYRKQHKKVEYPPVSSLKSIFMLLLSGIYLLALGSQDIAAEAVKKRRHITKKPYSRSIVGATLEIIQKKRTEKPEVRDAAREAALRYASFASMNSVSFQRK